MKRSVMEEVVNRRARTADGARVLMALIDKTGVTWDPEEEPMAERLEARELRIDPAEDLYPSWCLVAADEEGELAGGLREAEARLAAALYNRRGAIEEVARALRDMAQLNRNFSTASVACIPRGDLVDWADALEGK